MAQQTYKDIYIYNLIFINQKRFVIIFVIVFYPFSNMKDNVLFPAAQKKCLTQSTLLFADPFI